MSYMNNAEFAGAGIQELSFGEIDFVSGAESETGKEIGNVIMATGAAVAGAGALTAQPEIVAAGTVIAGVGGLVYLISSL